MTGLVPESLAAPTVVPADLGKFPLGTYEVTVALRTSGERVIASRTVEIVFRTQLVPAGVTLFRIER